MPVPPVFDLIAKTGKIPERDMYNTFNMGAGLVLAVAAEDAFPRGRSNFRRRRDRLTSSASASSGAEKGVELV